MENQSWIEKVKEELNDIKLLNPGWDGYNAPSIDFQAWLRATHFIDIIANKIGSNHKDFIPKVSPTVAGSVRIFIPSGPAKSNGEYDGLEIEFDRNGVKSFEFRSPEGIDVSQPYDDNFIKMFIKLFEQKTT